MQRMQKNMTKEEWIQFIVISAIYVVFNITKELIKERKSKKWKQNLRTDILTRATVEAQFMKKARYKAWRKRIWLN